MKGNSWKKALSLLCAFISLLAWLPTARATTYATQGNAGYDTMFYATCAGSGALTLYQTGMGLMQEYNRYQTAQTQTEYLYAQYIILYKGTQDSTWQQGGYFSAQNCTINLPRADIYTVWVRPVTPQDMNQRRTLEMWQYQRWLNTPAWYVGGVRNCGISSVNPQQILTPTPRPTATPTPRPVAYAPVTVLYQDLNTQQLLASDTRYLSQGTQVVVPTRSFTGYALTGSNLYYVTVGSNGYATPAVVTFYYYRLSPATPTPYPYYPIITAAPIITAPVITAPVITAPPTPQPTAQVSGNIVVPIAWDTQFKPSTAKNSDNYKAINRLPNLYDDNRHTAFFWIVYTSEWQDDVPEITAYFGGATVARIGLRNGNTQNATQYVNYARPYRLRIRVVMKDGTSAEKIIDIPDQYNNSFQKFSLGKTYENVDRIEVFLHKYKVGQKSKNVVYISDMVFYPD